MENQVTEIKEVVTEKKENGILGKILMAGAIIGIVITGVVIAKSIGKNPKVNNLDALNVTDITNE